MTLAESKAALAAKLDISITDIANNQLFTDSDLEYWLNVGIQKAWDYKPWPFTTKTKSFTTVSDSYYDHPSDLMPHSVFRLAINGEEFDPPILFEDYLKYKEDNPNGTEKAWAMHENFILINQGAYAVGESADMTGKKFPPASPTILPFSPTTDNQEHSGNHAIVEFAYAEALASDKLKRVTEADVARKDGYRILDLLWKPFADQRAFQHSRKSMFNVPDFFQGNGSGPSPIGNFNI